MNSLTAQDTFPPLTELDSLYPADSRKTVLIGASHLQMDLLPELYGALTELGKCDSLDVLIAYCPGGEINVARRIALLFREFSENVRYIVPHYCQSAGTILCLSGHEIIAGPLAIFSPIDPQLHSAGTDENSPGSLSALEIKDFGKMAEDWFSLPQHEAQAKSLEVLCSNIFPPTLTSFYRSCEEIKHIATELLNLQMPYEADEKILKIIEKLMFGYHSHSYALTGEELAQIGLNVKRNVEVEQWAWNIAQNWQSHIGGKSRTSETDSWNDTLIATSKSVRARHRSPGAFAPRWQYFAGN